MIYRSLWINASSTFARYSLWLFILIWSDLSSFSVFAQRADVPEVDKHSNFPSARVIGNRGFYYQTYWLVVDRDSAGLNCLSFTPEAQPQVSLKYGSIIMADMEGQWVDPVFALNGQTWLRVTVNRTVLQRDYREKERSIPIKCIVRANSAFIAPINQDDLREFAW